MESYPEDYLREISGQGFDGIWVHIKLRETVPTRLFLSPGGEKISVLNKLVEKTSKHGIKVYAYLLEPRALPKEDPFWQEHPHLAGQPSIKTFALCSSTPEVRGYLHEGSYNLFRLVPGLGGAFMINASELHTHCYSHLPRDRKRDPVPNAYNWEGQNFHCERCAERLPQEVAAEVINEIASGIKKADKDALAIAWSWSWYQLEPDPQVDLMSRLSKDIVVMSDFERGGRKKVVDRMVPVDEYSHSYIGPSPRFKKRFETARKNKLKFMAKIQITNTHELASVPYIPVPFLLAEKFGKMRASGAVGYLGCWIFGGDASPMTMLAGLMSEAKEVPVSEAVKKVAVSYFGDLNSKDVCRAWKKFSSAWREYPFSIPMIYRGPLNYSTVYPLHLDAKSLNMVHSHAPLPRDSRGRLHLKENSTSWLAPFPPEIFIEAFRGMLLKWGEGVEILRTVADSSSNDNLKNELNLALHIGYSLRSIINIIKFLTLKDKLGDKQTKVAIEILSIMKDEIETSFADKKLIEMDSRLGFHAEANQRLYLPGDFDYKIRVLKRGIKEIKGRWC